MKAFLLVPLKLLVALLLTLPTRRRDRQRRLMLVSERGDEARDNGYHFFLHVKQHHPEVEAYYVITPDSPDRPRLDAYGDSLVDYLSLRHCILFCRAHWLVGTHLRAGHTPLPFVVVKQLNRHFGLYRHKKVVNLKHGITKNYIDRMVYRNTRYDLLVSGAAPERDYFIERYGYPPSTVKYTGFCRFDKLADFQVKRQILVMPTWRSYIDLDHMADTDYFRAFRSLLTHPRLAALLEKHDMELVFYPHHRFQPVAKQFCQEGGSPRIVVADRDHYDVQQLLKESALMVTDYSSVLFDFVYMKKPVLFYHFDREDYLSRHFKPGYVSEEAFGPVATKADTLLSLLEQYLEEGLRMAPEHEAVIDRFFPLRDQQSCARVFEAVMHC